MIKTYERSNIQKWLDSNHRTCSKTQNLDHLLLAPNFALKNLILQWCEKNKYHLPNEAPKCVESLAHATNDARILSLVQSLLSSKLEEQRAVEQIWMLSKESSENITLIANAVISGFKNHVTKLVATYLRLHVNFLKTSLTLCTELLNLYIRV